MNQKILALFVISILFSLLFLPILSFAHVGYVLDKHELESKKGNDFLFLLIAFTQPINIAIMIVTLVVAALIYFFLKKNKIFIQKIAYINKRTKQYYIFIPWIARLGLGISLIGAGATNVLVSPIISAAETSSFQLFSFLQVLIGFFILAGFLTGIAALISIIFYVIAISNNFYILGNLDYLGLALTIIALGDAKPGIDDLFGIPFLLSIKKLGNYVTKYSEYYVPLIIRLALGTAMMFLAVYEKILNPHITQLVVEKYNLIAAIPVSPSMWVLSAGIIEFIVAFAIFVGFKTRLFSAIAFIVLTASFFYFNEQVFSHVTLFAALSVLFITDSGKISLDDILTKKITKNRRITWQEKYLINLKIR